MDSLLLCSSFTTNTLHSRLNSAPKPPARRLVVSCSGGDGGGKVDRRNVLLGIGGLYGVGTLATPDQSTAEPLPPVVMDKCSRGTNLNTNKPLDFDCCPPSPAPEPIAYKLPPIKKLRVRSALHLASRETLAKYQEAVAKMKALPKDDPRSFAQQASVHCAYCNLTYEQTKNSDLRLQIHNCNHFYPWHRWYLYFYEKILGKLIGDPSFALPFWNWDHPDAMVMPDVFTNENSPVYNVRRDLTHYPPAKANLLFFGKASNDPENVVVQKNLAEVYGEMVTNAKSLEDFYGAKYSVGTEPDPGPGTIERGSHTALHVWVGERTPEGYDMGNFATAGREPIFFTHHTNIDRLWSLWRNLRAKVGKPADFTDKDWLNSEYLFYDEEKRLVKVNVADSLVDEKMGYTYQKVDNVWLQNRPKPKAKQSQVAKKTTAPKAAAPAVFPAKLDKVLKVLVDRPKKSRSKKDKDEEEELLVIEGIEVNTSTFVRFEVFVNDEDDKPEELIGNSEYAGCFSQVPQKNSTTVKTKIRLGLTDLLEDLDVEGDDQILVSIVPRAGGEGITIGGIKIIYQS